MDGVVMHGSVHVDTSLNQMGQPDAYGVPAKIEHRGRRKKVFTGTRCRLGMELGIIRAHAREYRAARYREL